MSSKINDEIDLIEILKKLYTFRKDIFYTTIFSLIIGVLVAFFSPIKYESYTVFIPQNQESNTSSFSSVASLVGINLGSSFGGDIPPSMYPQIGESPKFKRLILDKIIDNTERLTLKDFLVKHHRLENENDLKTTNIEMTELEESCFKILSNIISINVNQTDGFITINSIMPDAKYSAIVAKMAREILQNIIIENKIETARQNLIFSENQLKEKKLEFNEIQSKLAYFSDSNLNLVNSFIINEKDKLKAQFDIISAVVTELSKQVEQAKLQVTKDTPVFSTIKEAIIPIQRTSPKRKQLVLIFGFIGFSIACIYILIAETLIKIINEIKHN